VWRHEVATTRATGPARSTARSCRCPIRRSRSGPSASFLAWPATAGGLPGRGRSAVRDRLAAPPVQSGAAAPRAPSRGQLVPVPRRSSGSAPSTAAAIARLAVMAVHRAGVDRGREVRPRVPHLPIMGSAPLTSPSSRGRSPTRPCRRGTAPAPPGVGGTGPRVAASPPRPRIDYVRPKGSEWAILGSNQ
jgi:hypothetical protein